MGWLRSVRGTWLRWRWEIVSTSGVLVLGLGWWGFAEHFDRAGRPRPLLDSLYRSLGLFVFEGGDDLGDVPVQLQVARFLAPAVILAAAVGAAMAVLHREVQRFMARRVLRGHVVIVGLRGRGLRLARQLVATGRHCVLVDVVDTEAHSRSARLLGIPVVTSGEADQDLVDGQQLIDMLQRAGIARAQDVVVMTGSPELDARFAHVLYELQLSGRAPARAYVEMDDLDSLRSAAGVAFEVAADGLEWFSLADRAAKSLLDKLDELLAVKETRTDRHLVVVGATPVGRSVIVQAARNWSRDLRRRQAGPGQRDRLVLTLIEPSVGSEEVRQQTTQDELRLLRRRDPRVPAGASALGELHVHTCDLTSVPLRSLLVAGPSAVVITADDDRELLRRSIDVAMDLPDAVPVWLCTERSGGLVDVVTGPRTTAGGRPLNVFHVLDTVLREDGIRRGSDEEVARAVHQAHRRYRTALATSLADLDSAAPWDDLAPELRLLNYAAAAAWRRVLSERGYRLVPYATLGAESATLPPDLVEELAVAAHDAWSDEKRRQGFRRGRRRNADLAVGDLTHPDVGLQLHELSDDGKNWNLLQAAAVPEHLAAAGLQLYPRPTGVNDTQPRRHADGITAEASEALAAAFYEVSRRHALAVRDHDDVAQLPWEELSDSRRRSDRAAAHALPTELLRLGYTIQLTSGTPATVTRLTDEEIEEMAVAEHDRWVRDRQSRGYVYGPARNDQATPPTHPDLVGWHELEEVARNKDRVRVAAALRCLAELGYEIVRVS